MTSSAPYLRAWQLDTAPDNDTALAVCWCFAGLIVVLAIFFSGLSLAVKLTIAVLTVSGLLWRWRHRPRIMQLRMTPAMMHLTLHDQRQVLLLPPWRAAVLPAMISIELPGKRWRSMQLVWFRHQFSEDDWRVLCTLLKHGC